MEMCETNYMLLIEYDGSAYHGWQRQVQERTIQGEIEFSLKKLTGRSVCLIGSGRTDAGVHAVGQVANFRCVSALSAPIVKRALNALLPEDIAILDCRKVDERFHSRYDALGKTYRYSILNRQSPAALGRQYLWHIRRPLDTSAMKMALAKFLGTHDFKTFEGAGSPRSHTTRIITEARLTCGQDGRLDFYFSANGFLKHMVRNMVGTLVAVGMGKIHPDSIATLINARDRSVAPATAPGQGLCLVRVEYDSKSIDVTPSIMGQTP